MTWFVSVRDDGPRMQITDALSADWAWRRGWCDCEDANNPVEIPEAIAEDNQI